VEELKEVSPVYSALLRWFRFLRRRPGTRA